MIRIHLAGLTCLALALGYAGARDPFAKEQAPPGLFKVSEISDDAIVLKGANSVVHRSALRDLDIYDAGGKALTTKSLLERVKAGSIVLVSADETKVDPSYLSVFKGDTVVLVGVTVVLARADKPGRGWTSDLSKMKASEDPVAGKVLGADVKFDKIQLQNTGLSLQGGKDSMHIFLNLKPGQGIEGKTFEYEGDGQGAFRPAIHVHINSTMPPGLAVYQKGYTMRMEFGKEKDGDIPGKIYLCFPDDRKSWIAGSFSLTLQ